MAFKGISKGDSTEIKSLANPPEGVKKTLTCTLLLLGHPASQANDWFFVKGILASPTFLQDIENTDPKKCNVDHVTLAKGKLDTINRDDVKKQSMAAVSFYDWNTRMIYSADDTPTGI